jgi:hypothetical protein
MKEDRDRYLQVMDDFLAKVQPSNNPNPIALSLTRSPPPPHHHKQPLSLTQVRTLLARWEARLRAKRRTARATAAAALPTSSPPPA